MLWSDESPHSGTRTEKNKNASRIEVVGAKFLKRVNGCVTADKNKSEEIRKDILIQQITSTVRAQIRVLKATGKPSSDACIGVLSNSVQLTRSGRLHYLYVYRGKLFNHLDRMVMESQSLRLENSQGHRDTGGLFKGRIWSRYRQEPKQCRQEDRFSCSESEII
jgi:hypothetical protein